MTIEFENTATLRNMGILDVEEAGSATITVSVHYGKLKVVTILYSFACSQHCLL
jgi:hypothetical protein